MGLRLGVAVAVVLIALIGGRIIPSFTRNWLAKRGAERLPAVRRPLDAATLIATVLVAARLGRGCRTILPSAGGAALLAVAALHAARLSGWRGAATGAEPLVTILHVGYAWVPAGAGAGRAGGAGAGRGAAGGGAARPDRRGAMGTMVLAVMTRASLGHSGAGR